MQAPQGDIELYLSTDTSGNIATFKMTDATPPEQEVFRRRIPSAISAIEPLTTELMDWAAQRGVVQKVRQSATLVIDELVTNIVVHGYRNDPRFSIEVEAQVEQGTLHVSLQDDAAEFDPVRAPEPDTRLPLEEREIGGLGLLFVRRSVDHIVYERRAGSPGRNRVSFSKRPPAS